MSWNCDLCGPVPPGEVLRLTCDSPHGGERHSECGAPVELIAPSTEETA